jgi:hypothetical protein
MIFLLPAYLEGISSLVVKKVSWKKEYHPL